MNQIIGNPLPFKIGRKTLLVSYVSVGEWQVFGELLKQDETQAVLELVYYSLYRGGNTISKRAIRKLVRWYPTKLTSLIELICEISLPKQKIKETDNTENTENTENIGEADRNLKTVFRVLSKQHGWTPAAISDMSPAQIFLYLAGGPDGTGIVKMSGQEYQSFRARREL